MRKPHQGSKIHVAVSAAGEVIRVICEWGALAVSGPEGSVACGKFEQCAHANGWEYCRVNEFHTALKFLGDHPHWGSTRVLVLFCLKVPDIHLVPQVFRKARDRAETILYQYVQESSGQLAIRCVHENKARDFLVDPHHDCLLQGRFNAAFSGHAPYGPFSGLNLPAQNRHVFGVMPFGPENSGADWDLGVVPALKAARFEPSLSRDRPGIGILIDDVQRRIRHSALVIANITRYNRKDNPNVYYEIGYAMGRKRPCILLQQAGEKFPPADLRGHLRCEFINNCDLALQLYWGLRS